MLNDYFTIIASSWQEAHRKQNGWIDEWTDRVTEQSIRVISLTYNSHVRNKTLLFLRQLYILRDEQHAPIGLSCLYLIHYICICE